MGISEPVLVSPEAFVAAMTARWCDLGNIPSPRLQQLWRTIAITFADAISARDQKWRVLQPPTGTGKTQGLCVYSALTITKNLSSLTPIGILVVTRTIQQANEIVDTIRELIPVDAADRVQTKHSENKISIFAMDAADVLVVTHAAYTLALEELYAEENGRWSNYTHWQHGPRRLTIIDEALSGVVEENQVRGEAVRQVLGCINAELRLRFPGPVNALEAIQNVLHKIDIRSAIARSKGEAIAPKRVVWSAVDEGRVEFPAVYSMGPLREAMAGLPYDRMLLRKNSSADRARIAQRTDETLQSCEAIMKRWAYYYQKGKEATLNSSQLLIPDDLPGPVVLDATATQNFLWPLLGPRAVIVPIPEGTRNYGNVNLHVARVSAGLGKGKMQDSGKTRIPRLLAELERRLLPDRKVLLCLHKDIKHIALSYCPNFATYSVANWGAIDGKNDWNDHDIAVIFGMPYRDEIWSTNMFFALQGRQDNDWLEQPFWGQYANVHKEMRRRQLVVSIIQAINRAQCRRVIDAEGNCPPTDVFILLPSGGEGDKILGHIQEEMPGVVVKPWSFELDGPQERIRRGSSHAALLAFMRNRLPGETAMSLIRKELGLSKSAHKDLMIALRDEGHPLSKALEEIGVRYVSSGRGARSFLLKS